MSLLHHRFHTPTITYLSSSQPAPAHAFAYDPTCGYSAAQLLAVEPPEPPIDFADFWRTRTDRALAIEPAPEWIGEPEDRGDHIVRRIRYRSTDQAIINGWVSIPASGEVTSLGVIGHGYGARGDADPTRLLPGSACIYPCARGLGQSPFQSDTAMTTPEHVVYGIESRDTYIHGGCVDDYLCAATVLQGLFPEAREVLYYDGGSFGGGIGALLLAWDLRFRAGLIRDPSFGHYPLRVSLPCKGSGHTVTQRYQSDPAILEVLRYFDAASAARSITTPMHVTASLFDPSVPPPGQFAIYNAMRLPQRHLCIKTAGHSTFPAEVEEGSRLREEKIAFLKAALSCA